MISMDCHEIRILAGNILRTWGYGVTCSGAVGCLHHHVLPKKRLTLFTNTDSACCGKLHDSNGLTGLDSVVFSTTYPDWKAGESDLSESESLG